MAAQVWQHRPIQVHLVRQQVAANGPVTRCWWSRAFGRLFPHLGGRRLPRVRLQRRHPSRSGQVLCAASIVALLLQVVWGTCFGDHGGLFAPLRVYRSRIPLFLALAGPRGTGKLERCCHDDHGGRSDCTGFIAPSRRHRVDSGHVHCDLRQLEILQEVQIW